MEYSDNYQKTYVEGLWQSLLLLTLVGLPLSAMRAFEFQQFVEPCVHLVLAMMVLVLNRYKASFKLTHQVLVVAFIMALVGIVGLTRYGLFSAGLIWLLFSALSMTFFFPRLARKLIIAFVCTALFFALAHSRQWFDITRTVSPENAARSIVVWLSVILPFAILLYSFSKAVGDAYKEMRQDKLNLGIRNKELHSKAHTDTLTELPNRAFFYQQLLQKTQQPGLANAGLALLFIDLDGFKAINDTWGHEAGDTVLRITAWRMQHRLRDSDIICRLGGDEFVLLCNNISSKAALASFDEQINVTVTASIDLPETLVNLSCSIGGVLLPEDGSDIDALLSLADKRMYRAKKAGKNQYCLTDE